MISWYPAHHFMASRKEQSGSNDRDFIFLGFRITVDGDCNHEMKRHLLLGRKAMTKVDSILTSSGITLLTKICRVKTRVKICRVIFGCENWAIKKAGH